MDFHFFCCFFLSRRGRGRAKVSQRRSLKRYHANIFLGFSPKISSPLIPFRKLPSNQSPHTFLGAFFFSLNDPNSRAFNNELDITFALLNRSACKVEAFIIFSRNRNTLRLFVWLRHTIVVRWLLCVEPNQALCWSRAGFVLFRGSVYSKPL